MTPSLLPPPTMPDYQYSLTDCSNLALIIDTQISPALQTIFQAAQQAIFICQYQFRVPHHPRPPMRAVTTAILRAAQRGVRVRILLNNPTAEDQTRKDHGLLGATLKDPRIEIRHHNASRIVHAKLVVVDEAVVILGSHNFSQPSFDTSRNVSVLLHSPTAALRILRVYEPLWEEGAHGQG